MLQKVILHLYFTKSLKRNDIYKFCLRTLKEHICLVITPQHVLRLRSSACAGQYELTLRRITQALEY